MYYDNLAEVSEYSKLKFDNRIIKSLYFSTKTRCSDCCVAFRNSNNCYCFGLVEKILMDKNKRCALLVSHLSVDNKEQQIPVSPCGIGVTHIISVSKDRCVEISTFSTYILLKKNHM